MSVLIFVDHLDGHIKKASHEALSYGAKLAEQLGMAAEAIVLGTVDADLRSLGENGIGKVYQVQIELSRAPAIPIRAPLPHRAANEPIRLHCRAKPI